MLTAEQVAEAKTFPGCGDITADNAVDKLFAAAKTLQKDVDESEAAADQLGQQLKAATEELAPLKASARPTPDATILALVAGAAETEMAAAVDAQALTPGTAAELKALLVGDPEKGQFNAAALTAGPGGKPLAVGVFNALRRNGKAPQVGKAPAGQAAPKTIAGRPDDADAPSPERLAELLAATPLGQSVAEAARK